MRVERQHWMVSVIPAVVLLLALLGRTAIRPDRVLSPSLPLSEFPGSVGGFEQQAEEPLTSGELRILQHDDYLLRTYRGTAGTDMTLFVAFYGQQTKRASIHSPRNCLPGSGWEPVQHDRIETPTAYGTSEINRYLVEHASGSRALVYYWYQGRGRVAANEYTVKLHLLRDALFRRRTDEALVRLVIPISANTDQMVRADAIASRTVRDVIRILADHVPA